MQDLIPEVHDSVPGMTTLEGCRWLYSMAKQCSQGVIVEIGCLAGRSTICLAAGSRDGSQVKVYAVDPFNGGGGVPNGSEHDMTALGSPDPQYYINQGESFKPFQENVERFGLGNIIEPIVNYSELAHKEYPGDPVEFLFIDGDHRYNYVKLDIELWSPHLITGGILALDDYSMPGVKRVRKELIEPSPEYDTVGLKPTFHAIKV